MLNVLNMRAWYNFKENTKNKLLISSLLSLMITITGATYAIAAPSGGTDRAFTKISIPARQTTSYLATSRSKETDNKYSYVKIDTFDTCEKVKVAFSGGVSAGWGYLYDKQITTSDKGTWVKCEYTENTGAAVVGAPIVLGAKNAVYSSSSVAILQDMWITNKLNWSCNIFIDITTSFGENLWNILLKQILFYA